MDDAPVPKLAELLRHADDLDKIPSLKHEFARKKGAVDGQLRSGLREQLERTQSGMAGLADGQRTVQLIKDEMARIDRLCSESQTMIRDFASINLASQAHRHFAAVETMRRNLETFDARVSVVEDMLRADDEDQERMPNLLPCHYEITRLRNLRDDAMEQIQRADDPSLEATLEDYFARLDDVVDWFDEHVGLLAMNLINLVLNDNNGLVVRFAVIMEAEERSDRRVRALQDALRDHRDMAARFQGIADGAKQVRGYKDKFLAAIKLGAEQQFETAREEFLDDPKRLDKIMAWFFNDLNAVRVGMTPLMPKRWKIGKVYADIYHVLMHDFLVGMVDDPEASSAHTLEIVGFPEKYYRKMAKMGYAQDALAPHVIDNREAELVRDFRQLIIRFLDEWIERIFAQEARDFADRNSEGSNLDTDEYGYFRTKNLTALWRMLREQVDAAAGSQRADVVEGVVDCMFARLRARQQQQQRMLEDEALRYESGKVPELEGFQALQDWLVATANDQIACIDDGEDETTGAPRLGYLSSFRAHFEPHVTPQYLERVETELAALRDGYVDCSTWCINKFAQLVFAVDFRAVMPDFFTPRWYPATAMKQMVVTLDEYVGDYRAVLHHSLVDIFIEIFADELLVRYLSSVRNKGCKLRRADPFRDKLFNDIATAFEYFGSLDNADVGASIKQTWRVTEGFLALLSADRAAVPDEFAAVKARYWDLQISWVEAVLRSRDDFERSMLNAVKARAAQIEVVRGPETIMARIK
ncbi:exocyst complex component Sec6 [Cordyceps militaris]|uniref:Exocyst complex component Sec6 n=1 Tax=Cordyceps militaris TaxID=73501 RepID=A0A2H4SEP7_CORMI|nr:exocyst complex component Sec6 [Cordyceps militaris]